MSKKVQSFRWEEFNHTYGPWYRLRRLLDGVRSDLLIEGCKASAVVQPDMDNTRYFWTASIEYKGIPRKVKSGVQPTVIEAKEAAEDALAELQTTTVKV